MKVAHFSPRKIFPPHLIKHKQNPIISPNRSNYWEALQTFNPGAVLIDDKVHLLYRAVGPDGVSRLGYAVSDDGINFDERLPYPVYEHNPKVRKFNIYSFLSGGSYGGCEDPRLVCIDDDDKIYMTYTACDGGLRVGLTSIDIDDFLNNKWRWSRPSLISPRKGMWDSKKIGVAAPPIKTSEGWILFYHGVSDEDNHYRVGAVLLDIADPLKILARSEESLLEPTEKYEVEGQVPNVVFPCGAVLKGDDIYIYYGGGDSVIGGAKISASKQTDYLGKCMC